MMTGMRGLGLAGALGMALCGMAAQAAVVTGPDLPYQISGYETSGLAFTAAHDSVLRSFTFRSQGLADTITLTDLDGTVLQSRTVTAGSQSNQLSVDWALAAGTSYRLLQTTADNGMFGYYGDTPPSNFEIGFDATGIFQYSASSSSFAIYDNRYWGDFNDIVTSSIYAPETITSPTLDNLVSGYDRSGLAFTALRDATLTAFTFQSQGLADTVTLTDLQGNILYSQAIAAGRTVNDLAVDWQLTAGTGYRLLQTSADNGTYGYYNQDAPANDGIALDATGIFGDSGQPIDRYSFYGNTFWGSFSSLTTAVSVPQASDVPEPATWTSMVLGFGVIGAALRRRARPIRRYANA